MSKRLGWGFLGTGNIARQFAAGIRNYHRAHLAAVGSRNTAKAQAFVAENYPAASAGTYEQVLANPDVDVVYVALPNSMHHGWTLKALAAGKHVLCEKPIAANCAQAEEMFDAAERAGLLLLEAFMYRCHPHSLAIIDAVRKGAIGKLRMVRTSFSFRTRKPEGNVRFSKELAGGSLMDVGCYCIDFSSWLAGAEPQSVHAVGNLHDSGVDELVAATMVFPDGLLASFTCGLSAQSDNTAYLCGTEGYLEVPVPWKPPARNARYTLHRQPAPLSDNMNVTGAQNVAEVFSVDAGRDLYTVEAEDFTRTILDGAPPRLKRADSLGTMKVLDELRRQLGVLDA